MAELHPHIIQHLEAISSIRFENTSVFPGNLATIDFGSLFASELKY